MKALKLIRALVRSAIARHCTLAIISATCVFEPFMMWRPGDDDIERAIESASSILGTKLTRGEMT
jgi:hypothetical protein